MRTKKASEGVAGFVLESFNTVAGVCDPGGTAALPAS